MSSDGLRRAQKWLSPHRSPKLSPHRDPLSASTSSDSPLLSSQLPRAKSTPAAAAALEEELREVFRHFDGDGDGKVSGPELRAYLGSVGTRMSEEEARGVIRDLDRDGDELLDFEDFKGLMRREEEAAAEEEKGPTIMRRAFEMFELEKGAGCITPRGLQRTLSRLGDEKSYDECVAMIRAFDVDGNGVIDYNEFHQMMA